MRYLKNVLSWVCPVIFITSICGVPEAIIRVVAVCRQSCRRKSSILASRHAVFHDRLTESIPPNTRASVSRPERCHISPSSIRSLAVNPIFLAFSVLAFSCGTRIEPFRKSTSESART